MGGSDSEDDEAFIPDPDDESDEIESDGGGEIVNLFSLRSTTLTGNLVLSRSGKWPGLLG